MPHRGDRLTPADKLNMGDLASSWIPDNMNSHIGGIFQFWARKSATLEDNDITHQIEADFGSDMITSYMNVTLARFASENAEKYGCVITPLVARSYNDIADEFEKHGWGPLGRIR